MNRAQRRREQHGRRRRPAGDLSSRKALYEAYIVHAFADPTPEVEGHVQINLGIGVDGELPAAGLMICSHQLEQLIADLRLAVNQARAHPDSIVAVLLGESEVVKMS